MLRLSQSMMLSIPTLSRKTCRRFLERHVASIGSALDKAHRSFSESLADCSRITPRQGK